jgi:hypothetical protein
MSEPYDREHDDDERDDVDDRDRDDERDDAEPTTLEEALALLHKERRRTSKATKEAGDRRHNERVLKEQIAELEAAAPGEWRGIAVKALVEATAREQGARKPGLVARLVDLDELAGETEEELRLHVTEAVAAALADAPELRGGGQQGALSLGVRQRLDRHRAPDNESDWLRRAARGGR